MLRSWVRVPPEAPYGVLAQLVEHLAHNRTVPGSNPRYPTKYAGVVELADTQDLGSCGAIRTGSSPVTSTIWLCTQAVKGTVLKTVRWRNPCVGSNPTTAAITYTSEVLEHQ